MRKILLIVLLVVLLLIVVLTGVTASESLSLPWFGYDQYNRPGWSYDINGFSSGLKPWDKNIYISSASQILVEKLVFRSETRTASYSLGPLSGSTYKPLKDQMIECYSRDNPLMPASYAKVNLEIEGRDSPYKFTFTGAGDNLGGFYDPPPIHYPNTINSTGQIGLLDTSITDQLSYPDRQYANSLYFWDDFACFFLCVCKEMRELGIQFSELELHTWLQKNHGFSGLKVDCFAVVRWASQVKGINIGHKRCVPFEEAIARGYKFHCSVKFEGHWVCIVGYRINKDGTISVIIADPSNGRHRYIEDYSGVGKNNTRCFYKKAIQPKPIGSSVVESGIAIADETRFSAISMSDGLTLPEEANIDLGLSAISIFSMSQIQMSLRYQGAQLANSVRESLENARTGEKVDIGAEIALDSATTGEYELVLQGSAGTPYQVTVRSYDYAGDMKESIYSGIIPAEGAEIVKHFHSGGMATSKVSDIMSLSDGTNFLLTGGVVTYGDNYWLQVQNKDSVVPTIQISLPPLTRGFSGNPYGREIAYMAGKVKVDKGVKSVIATDVVYLKTGDGSMPKPVGVNLASVKSTRGIYAKIWGKVTFIGSIEGYRDNLTLDGKFTVKLSCDTTRIPEEIKVGDLITVTGISCYNWFYVGNPNNIEILK